MAIALAASSTQQIPGNTVTTFPNVVVPITGIDRLLVVAVGIRKAAGANAISSVTYAGQTMTAAGTSITSGAVRSAIYYLVAPPTGSSSVVVTLATAGTLTFTTITASSWTGVHQTTPLTGYNSATGTSAAPSVPITNATLDVVVDAMQTSLITAGNPTIGAGQTQLGTILPEFDSSQEAGANSTSMDWTLGGSGLWVTCGVALQPSAATTPLVTGPTGTVAVSEMRIVPLRSAPSLSPNSGALAATRENMQAQYEASSLFPKVIIGTIQGTTIVWDDVYTLPSNALSGAIAITGMPAKNSPNASIVATTQDAIIAYPFPYGIHNNALAYPKYAGSSSSTTMYLSGVDLLPVFYPSRWDAGDVLHTLIGVHVIGANLTNDVDRIGISWCWDETNAWSTVQWAYQPDAYFSIPKEMQNFGTRLSMAVTLIDSVGTDPIGPAITGIISWAEERTDIAPGTTPQIARTIPEAR